jgi:hypothetical protein
MDGRLQSGECDVLIRRVCGDTVFTGAQNGQRSIEAFDRGATRPRLSLIARRSGVSEIDASGPLHQVPGVRIKRFL